MSNHQAISMSLTSSRGPLVGRADVLEAEISLDPLRTPQITVALRTPPFGGLIEPFTREPAQLRIVARRYGAGTLRELDAAKPPATLGEMRWSDHADRPVSLDGERTIDYDETEYTLQLFCTKITSDEVGGTAEVLLASADYILEEITNAGFDWLPTRDGDGKYRLKSALRQMLSRLNVPLTVPEGPEGDVVIADENMRPWTLGETARAWLDELRAAHGAVWMVSAHETTMQPSYVTEAGLGWYWSDALEERLERGTDVSSITGHARWCDAYQIIWTWTDDADVEHTVLDLATLDDTPWWRCRKIITEQLNTPPTGLTAAQRLARAQAYQNQLSITVPMTALPEPYVDLKTWERARPHLASLSYRYPEAIAVATLIGV